MSNLAVPPSTAADAANRAWRTLAQGLATDVAAAVAMAVLPELAGSDFAWTRAYWVTLGLLAAKTAVMTVVSYVARKVLPPAP
jgi:hypothetical protein